MSAKIEILKNKLITEDIEVGTGIVTQDRAGQVVQGLAVNASQLLGVLVVDKVSKLADLQAELLLGKTVVVKENHTIYVWDEIENKWKASITNIYIVDTPAKLQEVPEGNRVAYVLSNNLFYTKSGDAWNVAFNGLYVIDSYENLNSVPDGIQSVIVKTTGALYFKDGLDWIQVQFVNVGDPLKVVSTIDQLSTIDFNQIICCIVTDSLRGGLFVYDANNAEVDNGGTIFNGWTRQFSGQENIYWYGVKGDGIADDTQALQKFAANNSIMSLTEGTYKISKPIGFTKNMQIIGNNSVIELVETATITFSGTIDPAVNVEGAISAGQNTLTTLGVSNFKPNDLALILSTDTYFSEYDLQNKKKYSFFSNVASAVGTTIRLTQGSKSYFTASTIQKVNAIEVGISNVTIKVSGARTNSPISFNYCRDTKIDNVNVTSEADAPVVSIANSHNILISNSTINAYGTNSVGVSINDSDNIVFRTSSVYGSKVALDLPNSEHMSNSIGLFASIFNTQNVKDSKSINCADGVCGLTVQNSQLTGDIALQGSTFLFENSIISLPYRIVPNNLQGGIIKFDNCVFYTTNTEIETSLFGNSELGVFKENLCKVKQPINFYIRNNVFVLTSQYKNIFELVSVSKGTSIEKVEHSVLYRGNQLRGSYANCIELNIYGPFDRFECDFMHSTKLSRLGKGIKIYELAQRSGSILHSLGLQWKCGTFNDFRCHSIYVPNKPTNTNPYTHNEWHQMCFDDIVFQYVKQTVNNIHNQQQVLNLSNIDMIDNVGIAYVASKPALVYYVIQRYNVNTSGYYYVTAAPPMPDKPTEGYA